MRLIDADEVVKAVHDEFDECLVWDESGETTANEFENIILQVPTVDIDAITESHERIGYDRGFRDGYAEALTDNAEPVKPGHWTIEDIITYERSYGGTLYEPVYKCSCCGRVTESYVRGDEPIMPEDADFPKFCGNCGAKMDEVEEDETD